MASGESLVAGPSSQPGRPECMQPGEPAVADQALRHLRSKRSFFAVLFPSGSRSKRKQHEQAPSPEPPRGHEEHEQLPDCSSDSERLVQLENEPISPVVLEEDYDRDVYRWAILYENQRGMTLFSTPYYSSQSLLPMDPPPFTIPSASKLPRAAQPTVSLSSYPLPDGTWRWVSRTWMVDMRGDGQTQYDGFEYNWFFRCKKWRSEVGHLNAGGWVRRRRWVRLMMRPAQNSSVGGANGRGSYHTGNGLQHLEEGATRPPSVVTVSGRSSVDERDVWEGEKDEDWQRCRIVLRRLSRDGRKLELWRHWLGQPGDMTQPPDNSDLRQDMSVAVPPSISTEEATVTTPARRERVASVLRQHGSEVLRTFIYPDSRAQYLELLADTGLLSELQTGIGNAGSLAVLDFWSYASSLDQLHKLGMHAE